MNDIVHPQCLSIDSFADWLTAAARMAGFVYKSGADHSITAITAIRGLTAQAIF